MQGDGKSVRRQNGAKAFLVQVGLDSALSFAQESVLGRRLVVRLRCPLAPRSLLMVATGTSTDALTLKGVHQVGVQL